MTLVRPEPYGQTCRPATRKRRRFRFRQLRTLAISAGLLIACPALAIAKDPSAEALRIPTWPGEISRWTGVLKETKNTRPEDRVRALRELSLYATPFIEALTLVALEDPEESVQNLALALCRERGLVACGPIARRIATSNRFSSLSTDLRLAILTASTSDGHDDSIHLVVAALNDRSEKIRARATELIPSLDAGRNQRLRPDNNGQSSDPASPTSSPDQAPTLGQYLILRLEDGHPTVRKSALQALSHYTPNTSRLYFVLTKLEDPEHSVREAAAQTLRRWANPKTTPALLRALESADRNQYAADLAMALAEIEGQGIEESLLGVFDNPPERLRLEDITSALASRRHFPPSLVHQLLQRLYDPERRGSVFEILHAQADRVEPELQAALAQHPLPAARIELEFMLRATKLEHQPAPGTESK